MVLVPNSMFSWSRNKLNIPKNKLCGDFFKNWSFLCQNDINETAEYVNYQFLLNTHNRKMILVSTSMFLWSRNKLNIPKNKLDGQFVVIFFKNWSFLYQNDVNETAEYVHYQFSLNIHHRKMILVSNSMFSWSRNKLNIPKNKLDGWLMMNF